MSDPRVVLPVVPDTTPAHELDALSTIYHRAIERFEENHAKKEGGPDTAPDDGTKIKGDSADAILHD